MVAATAAGAARTGAAGTAHRVASAAGEFSAECEYAAAAASRGYSAAGNRGTQQTADTVCGAATERRGIEHRATGVGGKFGGRGEELGSDARKKPERGTIGYGVEDYRIHG